MWWGTVVACWLELMCSAKKFGKKLGHCRTSWGRGAFKWNFAWKYLLTFNQCCHGFYFVFWGKWSEMSTEMMRNSFWFGQNEQRFYLLHKNPTISTSRCRGVFCKFAVAMKLCRKFDKRRLFSCFTISSGEHQPKPCSSIMQRTSSPALPHLNILILQNHWTTMILRGKSTSYRSKGQLMFWKSLCFWAHELLW